MTGAQFGSFLLGLIVVAIVVAIVVWLLHWLYLRSSRTLVRRTLGGQRVVRRGALVCDLHASSGEHDTLASRSRAAATRR